MSDEKLDKIIDELHAVKLCMVRIEERDKVSNIRHSKVEAKVEANENRINRQDRVVGAVVLCSGILLTLIKFKII